MYTLKTGKPILDVTGSIIPTSDTDKSSFTVGKAIGSYLYMYRGNKIDAMKAKVWGLSFYKGEDIKVDKADLANLKAVFEEDNQLTVMVKADILELFTDAVEDKE